MFKNYLHQRRFSKVVMKQPLYKPLQVRHKGMELDFSESLIDTCYLIHKSMIGVLDIHHKNMPDKVEMDHLVNQNADFVSSVLLHIYFTQWIQDVSEMQNMTDGGE